MTKQHISPTAGVGACTATIRPCPFPLATLDTPMAETFPTWNSYKIEQENGTVLPSRTPMFWLNTEDKTTTLASGLHQILRNSRVLPAGGYEPR